MHNNIIIMRSQGDEAPSHEQLQRAREPRYFEINTFGLNFSELLWIFNDKYKIMMKDDRSTMIEAIVQSWLKKVKLCLRRHCTICSGVPLGIQNCRKKSPKVTKFSKKL